MSEMERLGMIQAMGVRGHQMADKVDKIERDLVQLNKVFDVLWEKLKSHKDEVRKHNAVIQQYMERTEKAEAAAFQHGSKLDILWDAVFKKEDDDKRQDSL